MILEKWRLRGYAASTIHTRRKYLRMLLAHLVELGAPRFALRNLPKPKPGRPRAVIAEPDELSAIRAVIATWTARKPANGEPWIEPWLPCWFEITAGHGLRFAEARRLCAANFNPSLQTITFIGKGHIEHTLPATPRLQEFFRSAPASPNPREPLIERIAGRALSDYFVYKGWKRVLKKAGITRDLHPHDLRRTLAVRSMNATKDIRIAQQILGHASIATTALYLEHTDPEKLRPLLEELTRWTPADGTKPQ